MGAEVDYSESLQGAQFVIRNPNAKSTCGCGSSFTVLSAGSRIMAPCPRATRP
jgi:hypothetical protein